MMGLSAVHMLIFGIVAVVIFGNRLPSIGKSLRRSFREFQRGMRELEDQFLIEDQQRGSAMREHLKKFLWTSKFWAMLGLLGLVSGLYFQRVAANGSGLWCLGLM